MFDWVWVGVIVCVCLNGCAKIKNNRVFTGIIAYGEIQKIIKNGFYIFYRFMSFTSIEQVR